MRKELKDNEIYIFNSVFNDNSGMNHYVIVSRSYEKIVELFKLRRKHMMTNYYSKRILLDSSDEIKDDYLIFKFAPDMERDLIFVSCYIAEML